MTATKRRPKRRLIVRRIQAAAAQPGQPHKFRLTLEAPYTTLSPDGKLPDVSYVVDGILPSGTLSTFTGKPKAGKSVLALYCAVQVTKGAPFLDRKTTRGEVLYLSLEDPKSLTDHRLKALGWDGDEDAALHIAQRVDAKREITVQAIRDALDEQPAMRLIVADTLAKVLRQKAGNDYNDTMFAMEELHNAARDYPHVAILALTHTKKVVTEDKFDGMIRSTQQRGDAINTLAIWQESGRCFIELRVKMGRDIPPTELVANVEERGGMAVPTSFWLAVRLAI